MKNHLEESCERLHALSDEVLKLLSELLSAPGLEISDFNLGTLRDNPVVVCFFQNHLKVGQIVAGLEVVVGVVVEEAFSKLPDQSLGVAVVNV